MKKPVMNGVKLRRPFGKLFGGRFPVGLSKNCLSQYANQGMQLRPLRSGGELRGGKLRSVWPFIRSLNLGLTTLGILSLFLVPIHL
jgi:hypothetical protein